MRFKYLLFLLPAVAMAQVTIPDNVVSETAVTQHEAALSVTKSQVSDFVESDYATGAEGDLAATATQPGDNVSTLTNDAGYVTSGGASQLSDLSDVNTSTPTNRNVLVGDGVDFESRALVEADIGDLAHTTDTTLNQAGIEALGFVTGAHTTAIAHSATTGQTASDHHAKAVSGDIDHDATINFAAGEHIDWAGASAGTIHATNYVDADTTDHTALSNIGTNTHAQIDTHITTPGHVTTLVELDTTVTGAQLNTIATDTSTNNAKLTADTSNVTAAGALMDSEVTNLAQVKAFSSADYATAAQGATADTALQSVAADSITTAELSDAADVPLVGEFVQVATGGINVQYRTDAEVRADLDLEIGTDIDAAGTDNSTDVTLAGSGTYVTAVGQVLTVDPITESDIADLAHFTEDADTAKINESETITGDWDFSGGGIEIENGTTPPACIEGQLYLDTDATAGQQLMACDGGTFVLQGDGGGGGNLTTKGDLEVYTTSQTRLPVGTNDQVLTADSTEASGLKWATPAAGGSYWTSLELASDQDFTTATATTITGLTFTPSASTVYEIEGTLAFYGISNATIPDARFSMAWPTGGDWGSLVFSWMPNMSNNIELESQQIELGDTTEWTDADSYSLTIPVIVKVTGLVRMGASPSGSIDFQARAVSTSSAYHVRVLEGSTIRYRAL